MDQSSWAVRPLLSADSLGWNPRPSLFAGAARAGDGAAGRAVRARGLRQRLHGPCVRRATPAAVGSGSVSAAAGSTPRGRARHAVDARSERTHTRATTLTPSERAGHSNRLTSPRVSTMPLRRLTMPSAMRVLGLLASVRALQFSPAKRSFQLRSSAETELTIDPIAVTTDGEYAANEMAPDVAVEKAERFRAINAKDMDKLADKYPRLKDKVVDIKRSALIFPFKASPYLVDELIDWDMAGAYLGV